LECELFLKKSEGSGAWGELKLGLSGDVTFGVGVESGYSLAFWGAIDRDVSGSRTTTSATETVFSMSTNERYETSNTTNGDDADVFVSGAVNYSYSKTDKLEYDFMTCDVTLSKSATFNPDSISTFFSYSTIGVKDQIKVLQDLKDIDLASANPTHPALFYESQISAWEQMLQLNQKTKQRL
jgi:hypothetical protein